MILVTAEPSSGGGGVTLAGAGRGVVVGTTEAIRS